MDYHHHFHRRQPPPPPQPPCQQPPPPPPPPNLFSNHRFHPNFHNPIFMQNQPQTQNQNQNQNQNPPYYPQNPAFFPQNPSNFQNLNRVSAQIPQVAVAANVTPGVNNACGGGRTKSVAEIDAVVEKVRNDLVSAGENVCVWKVSRLVLRKLEAVSWVSLGVGLHDVPSLHRLVLSEAKTVKSSLETFITCWKEACMMHIGVELFEKILDFYMIKKGTRTELISCFSESPLVGLLNLAVISIRKGTWDSLSKTFQFNSEPVENVDDSIKKFVRTWKRACQEFTAVEAFEKMLESSGFENKERVLRHFFSNFPLMGFLDVAVISLRSGAWDSLCDTLQSNGELGQTVKDADALAGCKGLDVESIEKDSDVSSDGLTCPNDLSSPLGGSTADISEKVVSHQQAVCDFDEQEAKAVHIIESIRREEFGLDSNIESSVLKKQHTQLGRALHCLSEDLYSQNSRFLLELVQNADDNLYCENVEPTMSFIFQPTRIIVLNNERGFTAENIRALCNVGSSTKKGSSTGHIGQKGIGFKSVFRITDAPEIHSNGFHVKFDTSESQLGFVLPTIIPSCDFEMFQKPEFGGDVQKGSSSCNTCIMLPFKRKLLEGTSSSSIASMFSELHPSLLLFLRRLQCVKLRNIVDDSYIVMKKEIVGDDIVRVSFGKETMTWFVTSMKLHPENNTSSVQMTEISIALTLKETENGMYEPVLQHQPVFAFLPLRTYGLKFILQADFVLPSSKEEVDRDSPWNRWLLSEFPSFFVSAEKSFCSLPCFQKNPAKAVSIYMSFVPLTGDVQGFFSELPGMIISKLSQANCLLQEGCTDMWVPPCKVLRGWNKQAQLLLPSILLYEHLGLWFLHKDIDIPDALAKALGIQTYGPETLTQFIISLGRVKDGIQSMGLGWLFSWLNELHGMVLAYAPNSEKLKLELDFIDCLKKVPFIPLSDGTYSSLDEGTIWLHDYASTLGLREFSSEAFPLLYATLRTVNPALFYESSHLELKFNCMRMLQNIGVRLMSDHELIKIHILPSPSDEQFKDKDHQLMLEYITFVMQHLQSTCIDCHNEEDQILSELRSKAVILTNHGYKRLDEVPIHFSREFGNSIETSKFLHGLDYKWHEIDTLYLKNQTNKLMQCGVTQWRKFFQKLGVTDFVQVVPSQKSILVSSPAVLKQLIHDKNIDSRGLSVEDWESPELFDILYRLSLNGNREGCKYFLENLDAQWDDHFSDKVIGYCSSIADGNKLYFKSSLMACVSDIKWVASSVDSELHFPRELFYDCDAVRSILGCHAPCAVPKISSTKLLTEIGFKTQVTLDDALANLKAWRSLKSPFKASLSQMSKLYSFISKEMAMSRQQVVDALSSGPFIFVPFESVKSQEEVVAGAFLPTEDVYWQDSTGALDHIKDVDMLSLQNSSSSKRAIKRKSVKNNSVHLSKALSSLYPSLHSFFVTECNVKEAPFFRQYLQTLTSLSKLPLSQGVAKMVFRIFLWWSFGLECDTLRPDDIFDLKSCISQYAVLPSMQDKWVSAHLSFGKICWCDDDDLKNEFDHPDGVNFLYFGELTDKETEMLKTKVSTLFRKLEIRSLSEIVSREALCDDPVDSSAITSMINRVLPFALRYLYNLHPERYNQHKLSGFDKLRQLQIVTVKKLLCRNVIIMEKNRCVSKKQVEYSYLIQGNILYTTKDWDPHSVFLELSCLLFDGTPDLHLANFLQMLTLMAGSYLNHEQIDLFLLKNQNMVKLPDEDSFLLSLLTLPKNHFELLDSVSTSSKTEQISSKSSEKLTVSNSSGVWKPKTGTKTQIVITDEIGTLGKNDDVCNGILQEKLDVPKTASTVSCPLRKDVELVGCASTTSVPEQISSTSKEKSTFSSSSAVWKPKTGTKMETVVTGQNGKLGDKNDVSDGALHEKADSLPNTTGVLDIIPTASKFKEKSTFLSSLSLWKPKTGTKARAFITDKNGKLIENNDGCMGTLQENPDPSLNITDVVETVPIPFDDLSDIALSTLSPEDDPSESEKTELLQMTSTSQKAMLTMLTGRQGEEAAFKYYTDKAAGTVVNWVNQEKETGLPYDIMLGEEGNREYIEVKASRNARKSWFQITKQEWQFATEKGECFSVAHVIFRDQNLDRLTIYKNPVKLCQTGVLRLISMSSKCYFLRPVISDPVSL